MDWFTWLSKTSLDPTLVYEYGVAFAHNELEEEDIAYFNHEFLQSMGISIAKHRLEILKLAKKLEKSRNLPHRMSKLLVAIKRTKKCVSKYVHTWCRGDESAALTLVPMRSCSSSSSSSRWKTAMLKRNKRVIAASAAAAAGGSKENTLLLTNGSPMMYYNKYDSRVNSFSNTPMVVKDDHHHHLRISKDAEKYDIYDDYWSSSNVQDFRWDTMFHNLKPT